MGRPSLSPAPGETRSVLGDPGSLLCRACDDAQSRGLGHPFPEDGGLWVTEHGVGWEKGCLPVHPALTLAVDSKPALVWPFIPSLSTPCSPSHRHLHAAL